MAGRRVALKAIDWLAFAERVPPNQRSMFNGLKTRSDAIAAKLVKSFNFTEWPEQLIKIDAFWVWIFNRLCVRKVLL